MLDCFRFLELFTVIFRLTRICQWSNMIIFIFIIEYFITLSDINNKDQCLLVQVLKNLIFRK